jgi:hypothetical protein
MVEYLLNSIKTPDGTVLVSRHRHDYVEHLDKNGSTYMVDGGLDYLRRSTNVEPYEELSVEDDGKHETRRQHLQWGVNYTKDEVRLPETQYRRIMDLDTDHIEKILELFGHRISDLYKEVFRQELQYRELLENNP